MNVCCAVAHTWRDPVRALAASAEEPYTLALLSDGSAQGRWSYLARRPARVFHDVETLRAIAGSWPMVDEECEDQPEDEDFPPFRGGAAGLATYDWSARLERSAPSAVMAAWPDFVGGVYDSLLAFDHRLGRTWAIGRGADDAAARAQAHAALSWIDDAEPRAEPRSAARLEGLSDADGFRQAVAEVVRAIGAGEIFQANIAQAWRGRLGDGDSPLRVLTALARASPAPFAGYLRLPNLALVSNSPERFLQVDRYGRVRAQPIKGTRPRDADPAADERLATELTTSAKDRAENLMIVDLMRNDLARACRPGSVQARDLYRRESFANVHHLVSTVTGELAPGRTALDLFAAAFPPGSVTGAPKLQAMQVIARHEPPRGPYCGALFWLGRDGAFDASVLIRTLIMQQIGGGWDFEARAGCGITADSDPQAENEEAQAKIAAILNALGVGAPTEP